MAHLAPHQDPWFHEIFCGPATGVPLDDALAALATPRVKWLRRCVALVTVDNGYWREERLIEGLDRSLVLEIDSHRGQEPHREPMPAELARGYDGLVAELRRAATEWPSTDGLHREPGAARGDTIVIVDASILDGRALLGESAVRAFRKLVFPKLDVAAIAAAKRR